MKAATAAEFPIATRIIAITHGHEEEFHEAPLDWIGEADSTREAFQKFLSVATADAIEANVVLLPEDFTFVEVWADRPIHHLRVGNAKTFGDSLPHSWAMRQVAYGEAMPPAFKEMTLEAQTKLLRERTGGASQQPITTVENSLGDAFAEPTH